MPILAMSSGKVTALWGTAFVISPDGGLKSIKVGDNVDQGAQILTSVDGIVQLSPDKGASVLIKAVTSDADKVITGIDRDDPDLTPTAGLTGGTDGGLVPGLRVDRVVESVGQLEFSFGTERVPPTPPVGRAADSNGVGIVFTVGDGFASASEEGLQGGVTDNKGSPDTTDKTSVTGQLVISDPGANALTVTLLPPGAAVFAADGTQVNWVSDGRGGLIGQSGLQADSPIVATVEVDATGRYTFTLLSPLKQGAQGEDAVTIDFGVKVSDGERTVTSKLSISVEDDAPVAPDAIVQSLTTIDTNLMIVLDISASMSDPSGIDGLTRLQAAVKSIDNLIEQYADVGGLAVRLVTFSTTSQTQGDSWVTAEQAKSLLDGLVANGNTNYDYALSQAQAAFATAAGKLTGAQNVSYFFSDGDPTLSSTNPVAGKKGQNGSTTQVNLGDGIDVAEEAAWIAFLDANQIKSHAIGLGNGIAKTYLNPIAHDGQTKGDLEGIVVTSLNQLDSTLADTYQGAVSGTFRTTALMGADGFGRIDSVTVDGVKHGYDASQLMLKVHTALGGDLSVDMATGLYTYSGPQALTGVAKETFTFALADKDGDSVSSSLVIELDHALVLRGTSEADTLVGGPGSDVLTGGAGADVFAWRFSDHGALATHHPVDRITDFDLAVPSAGGDTLDLRDLLQGENAGNLQNYLEFDTSTANTVIKISSNGGFLLGVATSATETGRIVLEGVNIRTGLGDLGAGATDAQIVAKMLEQGKLLVDLV
ncbi:MAG: type I secretion C-terminal target domain-containing protein [Aquabacterium sp.]|nr:type I secretion C-terminal target domain-containing protein [Aquabacterium sp.]